MRHVLILVASAGCGRVNFESRSDALDEPDAMSDAAPDAVVACGYTCALDYPGGSTSCGAAPITVVVISPGNPYVLRADLAGYTHLEATIEVCDPSGPVFQIGDSSTNHRNKGDYTTSSNDAHLVIVGTDLVVHGNDYYVPPTPLATANTYVAAIGCSTRVITVSDQRISATGPEPRLVESEFALRLDPPIDTEGAPDRIWYLGINRIVNSVVIEEGSGLRTATFCLYTAP